MRVLRCMALAGIVGSVAALPGSAGANGGAYIGLDRTHYQAGETAVGRVTAFVPREEQGLLERGPFYALLLPEGAALREGRPLPDGTILLGAFSIEQAEPKWFEARVSFVVPDLPGGFYDLAFCNDPCSVSGLGEPMTGLISIVETSREGELLTERSRLQGRIYGLRRDLRKLERRHEEALAVLGAAQEARSQLQAEVDRLEAQLHEPPPASRREEPAGRPVIAWWAAAGVVLALLVLAAVQASRRRRLAPLLVPDTVEELEREIESGGRPEVRSG